MKTHTPAPWTTSLVDDTLVLAGGVAIATALGNYDTEYETRKADARLIATAPDLLEALRPFAAYADARDRQPLLGLGNSIHVIHAGTEFEFELKLSDCYAARAAIAKAEDEL